MKFFYKEDVDGHRKVSILKSKAKFE